MLYESLKSMFCCTPFMEVFHDMSIFQISVSVFFCLLSVCRFRYIDLELFGSFFGHFRFLDRLLIHGLAKSSAISAPN